MLPDANTKCHHTGFEKSCRDIVSAGQCVKFIHIVGTDPNTGQPVDKYGCADGFLHMLLIENAKEMRQVGGEMSAMRAEAMKLGDANLRLRAEAVARIGVPVLEQKPGK